MPEIKGTKLEVVQEVDLLEETETRYQWVDVPGGKVRIRSLNAAEFVELGGYGEEEFMVAAICMCVVNAEGHTKYTCHPDEFERLQKMDAARFRILCRHIQQFVLAGTDVDDVLGNLGATPAE